VLSRPLFSAFQQMDEIFGKRIVILSKINSFVGTFLRLVPHINMQRVNFASRFKPINET